MTVQSLKASRLTKALLPNAGSARFDFRSLAFDLRLSASSADSSIKSSRSAPEFR
jgi:hypothetical protein